MSSPLSSPEATSVHRPDGTVDLIVKGERARSVKRGDVLLTVAPTGQHYRAEVREVRSRTPEEAVCQTTGIIVNQPPRNVPALLRDGTFGVTIQGERARTVAPDDVVIVEDTYGYQWRARIDVVLWRGGSQYAAGGFEKRHYEPDGRLSAALCQCEKISESRYLGEDGGYRSA